MKFKVIASALFLVLITGFCDAKGKKTLLVADRKIACAGDFECIQIKEKASAQWRVYADTIEGFNYEEGYEYKLSVMPLQTKNTLSGLYEEKYKLLSVVSKRKTDYNPCDRLGGRKWVLVSMFDTRRVLSTSDTILFVQFNTKEGKLSGKNVCNSFTGSYNCQGSKISITNIVSTKMMCKKGADFEVVVFEFYNKSTRYTLTGNKLTLYQPDGSNMVFEGR